jgi:type II secretory pathway component GspD/PulD (secretin)
MNLPNELSIVNFSSFLHNSVSIPSGLSNILQFGGGTTLLGVGVTQATAFATIANATSNNLLHANVVALDGQPTSLLVGDHYPIVTNAYIGNTSNTPGQVFTPPPTINYEDLGLVLKITPSIHDGDEVTLDISAEYKVLGASTAVGIPIISNRKFTGKVRLKDGEWAVIAGLVSTTNSDSLTGYAGIGRIPFLRRLFGQTDIEKDRTDVLLVLKPHLMNLPPWDFPNQTIWMGTDTRPLTVF